MTPTANGHPNGVRPEWRSLRDANRAKVERIRGARLAVIEQREDRRRSLMEALALDWVTPYVELLGATRTGDPTFATPASYWQRRHGTNYPIYRTEQELNLLRAPARLLCATNSYAQGLVEGLTSYVVGSGYTYRVAKRRKESEAPDELVRAAQRVVDEVLARNQWYGGEQPGVEEELFGRSVEDGEFVLVHYPREDGWTDFRIPEPEQLTQPPGTDLREWGFGVCTEPHDVQKPLGYWLQWGDSPGDGELYEPHEITHFRRNVRRSMKRGLTDFCFDTLDAVQLAGRLRTNLGDGAAQQAAIVGVMEHESGTKDDITAFNDDRSDFTTTDGLTGRPTTNRLYRSGRWEDIPKGQKYAEGPGAQNAPAHLQVLDGLLRSAGVRWNAPEWLTSGSARETNYASSLTAENPFVRTVTRRQRGYREAFRAPVWFALGHYVRTHGLRAGGRVYTWDEVRAELDLLVEAPGPESRNKLEETQRAAIEIPLGLDSRQQFAQRQGRDFDQVEADNREYEEQHGQQGQPLPGLPSGQGPGPSGSWNAAPGLPRPESERPVIEAEEPAGRPRPPRHLAAFAPLAEAIKAAVESWRPDGGVTEAHGAPPHPGLVFDESIHHWVRPDEATGPTHGGGPAGIAAAVLHPAVAHAAKALAGKAADLAAGVNLWCQSHGLTPDAVLGDGQSWALYYATEKADWFAQHLHVDGQTGYAVAAHLAAHLVGLVRQRLKARRPAAESLQESEGSHKFACVLAPLGGEARDRLLALAAQVADEDLADDGREADPHVTVRYGLHGAAPDGPAAILAGGGPVPLRLGVVSVFPADGRPYDVLKVDVESPALVRAHRQLGALPHSDTHPEYRPHATIAYVKPGKGAGYAARMGSLDLDAVVGGLVFSDPDGAKTPIPLAGDRAESLLEDSPDDTRGPGMAEVAAALAAD